MGLYNIMYFIYFTLFQSQGQNCVKKQISTGKNREMLVKIKIFIFQETFKIQDFILNIFFNQYMLFLNFSFPYIHFNIFPISFQPFPSIPYNHFPYLPSILFPISLQPFPYIPPTFSLYHSNLFPLSLKCILQRCAILI